MILAYVVKINVWWYPWPVLAHCMLGIAGKCLNDTTRWYGAACHSLSKFVCTERCVSVCWLPVIFRLNPKLVCSFLKLNLNAQVHYCDHALSIVRPSLLTFPIFNFFSESTEQNSTKLDRMQDLNVLYQVCVFQADRKKKMMATLASDLLRHIRLLWNCWTEFSETWQEARSHVLYQVCFFRAVQKTRWLPLPLIGWDIFYLLFWNRWT